jgi:thymidylate synthase
VIVIEARNVNWALPQGITLLRQQGLQRESRNGPVLQARAPVTTVYDNPTERVLLHPWRDSNPFFHLMEALWMLWGSNELAHITPYVKRMASFSDDGGKTQPGAYGARWRWWFQQRNQLSWAIERLRKNHDDRRVVIQMYDALHDQLAADQGGKDIPCNLVALPAVSPEGKLDLTVFCRSNDVMWGAYGANAVHFSILQEYLAAQVGVPVGRYWQVSNNFHGYLDTLGDDQACWPAAWGSVDPYAGGTVSVRPLFAEGELLPDNVAQRDLTLFFAEGPATVGILWPFLRKVACPMALAHRAYRLGKGEERFTTAEEVLQQVQASDWKLAALQWLAHRKVAWLKAQDGGAHAAAG